MTDLLQQLTTLYAKHGIQGIRQGPELLQKAFGKTVKELSEQQGFPEAQACVEKLQEKVERRMDKLDTPDAKTQIAECLKLLLNAATFHKPGKTSREFELSTLRTLLAGRFAADWSADQKQHFEFVSAKVGVWHSFFLSYTSDGAKVINESYRKVIELYVEPEVLKKRDWDKDNLLAEAIVNRLQKRNLTWSFYDKTAIKVGDDLMVKIGPACSQTFAFVQLVQLETFAGIKTVNWCFEEYNLFLGSNQAELVNYKHYQPVFVKRFNALLTGDKIKTCPPDIPYDYESWRDRIFTAQRHLQLPRDPVTFDEKVIEVANEVLNLKHHIIGSVPD